MSYVPGPYAYPDATVCLYCDGGVLARGLCSKHYNRWRRNGEVTRLGPVHGPTVRRWGNQYGSGIVGLEIEPAIPDDGFWDRVKAFQMERLAA